jgi:lipopolysaccharide heptosyltransferase I
MERIELTADPLKILIVKPSSLGDIVHSLPFLCSLHARYPDAAIHWVVAEGNEGALQRHPMIAKLWIIRKDRWKKIGSVKETIGELSGLANALRRERFDLVVDLQGLLRSGMISGATGCQVRVGLSDSREGSDFFYTHKVDAGGGLHAVERYLRVAQALGCDTTNVSFPLPPLRESPGIAKLKEELGEYVVMIPGARWRTKRWPAERFGELASRLRLRSVVIGSGADTETAETLVAVSGGRAVSVAGMTTLGELFSVIRGAKFVITNDSGPMHIAAACGRPVVAIFGPTDPDLTGPYGSGHIIVRKAADCSPCRMKKCHDMKCMNEITVEDVYQAVLKLDPAA